MVRDLPLNSLLPLLRTLVLLLLLLLLVGVGVVLVLVLQAHLWTRRSIPWRKGQQTPNPRESTGHPYHPHNSPAGRAKALRAISRSPSRPEHEAGPPPGCRRAGCGTDPWRENERAEAQQLSSAPLSIQEEEEQKEVGKRKKVMEYLGRASKWLRTNGLLPARKNVINSPSCVKKQGQQFNCENPKKQQRRNRVKGQVRRARPHACGRQARNIIRGAPRGTAPSSQMEQGGGGGGVGK
jgi:hypothetical protein